MAIKRFRNPETGLVFEFTGDPLPYGVEQQVKSGQLLLVEEDDTVAVEPGNEAPDASLRGGLPKPKGNASRGTWISYAISQGMEPRAADVLSRDELAARFEDTGFDPDKPPARPAVESGLLVPDEKNKDK